MAYVKKDWQNGETITEAALDNIENGIAANDSKNISQDTEIQSLKSKDTNLEGRVTAVEGKTKNATKSAPGIVKQAAAVPEAAGENVTKAEFKALLDSLKAAGVMANS